MDIPFYSNTGDGTHCFQAALRMALAIVKPEREFSYEELDRISQKQAGKWTWPTAAMIWMIGEGLRLRLIEEFDYHAFSERGDSYLAERFGKEVARAQCENSDIERERDIAKRFIKLAPIEYRVPELSDIESEIAEGAVVIVNINAAALHGHGGYSGHFVVICEVGRGFVRLHDPGLPPAPNFVVPVERFDRAWSYPKRRDRNLLSIRRSSKIVS